MFIRNSRDYFTTEDGQGYLVCGYRELPKYSPSQTIITIDTLIILLFLKELINIMMNVF